MPPRTRNLRACFQHPLQVWHTVNSKTKFPGHHCDDGRSGKYRRTLPQSALRGNPEGYAPSGPRFTHVPLPEGKGFITVCLRES